MTRADEPTHDGASSTLVQGFLANRHPKLGEQYREREREEEAHASARGDLIGSRRRV